MKIKSALLFAIALFTIQTLDSTEAGKPKMPKDLNKPMDEKTKELLESHYARR